MSPEQRKTASEFQLHKRGIRINLQLPAIETNEEVQLRPAAALFFRLIALWAVVGAASDSHSRHFRAYVTQHKIEAWLSAQELEFLRSDAPSQADCIQFLGKRESLYFLAWCAGLVEKLEISSSGSDLESIMHLFPEEMEYPGKLKDAIRVRSKNDMLSWADLLYRLHWAVRHAHLIGKPAPANLNGSRVQEWHQAANWMIRYEDEDNWDHVGTDT